MKNDLYAMAHLFVAAIRLFEHRNTHPPSIEQISEMLSYSIEQGNHITNKLTESGVLKLMEGSFGNKLFIEDHLKIEAIPRGTTDTRLDAELEKFQQSKKGFSAKIDAIKAEQAEKKKSLFAELEKNLKKGIEGKKE